jgi:hypothetical protein
MRKSSRKSNRPSTSKGAKATSSSRKASPAMGPVDPIKKGTTRSKSGPANSSLVQLSVRVTRSFRQAARRVSLEEGISVQDLVIRGLILLGVSVEPDAATGDGNAIPTDQRPSEPTDQAAGSSLPGMSPNAAAVDLILALLGAAHELLRRETLPQNGGRSCAMKVATC